MSHTEKNLRLYPAYRVAASTQAWIPVFFLYFSQHVSFGDVVLLSSVYYASVVILELPSGYFSDRVGRRATLLISALTSLLAYLLFIFADDFAVLAAAQILLAAGVAFRSGTDTAFLYDTLCAASREGEYAEREAHAEKVSLIALACATLLGGLAGALDLRLAYVLSLLGALGALAVAWRFHEPGRSAPDPGGAFLRTLGLCAARLRVPLLSWLFVFHLVIFAVAHLPFEFYQPWIALLAGMSTDQLFSAPAVSGIVISVSMFGGSLGAAASVPWLRRVGLRRLLLGGLLLQLVIVAGMAALLHAAVLLLVFARNFPMALVHAPMNAAIAPLVPGSVRATYLSLQSLAARLAFAALLTLLSATAPADAAIDWQVLSRMLNLGLAIGFVCAVALSLTSSITRSAVAKDQEH